MNKKSIAVLLVLIGLPIGWYSYNKFVIAASLRAYAAEQCEIKGGYRTKGTPQVPGYLINSRAQSDTKISTIIEKLSIENFEFIEVPAHAANKEIRNIVEKRYTRSEDLKGSYYRLTLESIDSPFCKQFNAYRGTGRLSYALAGLNLNQCIGIKKLVDKSLLKSEYKYARSSERDHKARIGWDANRVQDILTGSEISSYRSFRTCVTGRASSGEGARCSYGEENIVRCPVNYNEDDPVLFKKFRDNDFVSTSSKLIRPMQTINLSLPKDKPVKQGVARLLDVSDQAPIRAPDNEPSFAKVSISQNGRAYIVADNSKTRAHELFIIDTHQRLIRQVDISGFTRGFVRFSDPVHIDEHLMFIAIQNVYQADPNVVLFEVSLAGELISSTSFDLPVSDIIQPGNHTWERVEAIKQVEGGYEMVVPHLPPGETPRQYLTLFLAMD